MNITNIAAIRTQTVSRAMDLLSMAWALLAIVGTFPSARTIGATSPAIKKARKIIMNILRIICCPPIKKGIRPKAQGIGQCVLQLIPMPHFGNAKRIRQ
jgi:hypothetical protein